MIAVFLIIFTQCFSTHNNNNVCPLYDINSKAVKISISSTPVFFIFYNGPACSSCFTKIENFLRKNDSNSKIYLFLIAPQNLRTRLELQEFTKRFIKPDGYFYGIDKEDKLYDTFAKSSKSKTPNILKIISSGVKAYSFDDIFDENGNLKLIFE
jgi:hypothetical protein